MGAPLENSKEVNKEQTLYTDMCDWCLEAIIYNAIVDRFLLAETWLFHLDSSFNKRTTRQKKYLCKSKKQAIIFNRGVLVLVGCGGGFFLPGISSSKMNHAEQHFSQAPNILHSHKTDVHQECSLGCRTGTKRAADIQFFILILYNNRI